MALSISEGKERSTMFALIVGAIAVVGLFLLVKRRFLLPAVKNHTEDGDTSLE
jgi:nitrate reductase gamma subunit